jgi:ketosteroid isomerase-like protein
MTTYRRSMASLPLAMALALLTTSPAAAQGIETPRVPLRTALKEINTLRAEYAALYNRKDTAALSAMYLPDAILIRADGSTLKGRAAISKAFSEEAAHWGQITLSSDTTEVFGNTASDVGSLNGQGPDGAQSSQRYLAVLRRGIQTWQIASVAVVPETTATATK